MPEIYVLPKWNYQHRMYELRDKGEPYEVVDTTSGGGRFRGLSPFVLGPCKTYTGIYARNFENLWQYSKVYGWQTIQYESGGNTNIPISLLHPSNEWYKWRKQGWDNPKAVRYPMGKGVKALFSHWQSTNMDYVTARKRIYAVEYCGNVVKTDSFRLLRSMFKNGTNLILLDYDAYDHRQLGIDLKDVINNPDKKCGHAFILAMILTGVLPDCIE